MGKWICDDRESPEEWEKRHREYRSMINKENNKQTTSRKREKEKEAV